MDDSVRPSDHRCELERGCRAVVELCVMLARTEKVEGVRGKEGEVDEGDLAEHAAALLQDRGESQ